MLYGFLPEWVFYPAGVLTGIEVFIIEVVISVLNSKLRSYNRDRKHQLTHIDS
jgi:hypothetical protein